MALVLTAAVFVVTGGGDGGHAGAAGGDAHVQAVGDTPATQAPSAGAAIDFNRDIRPILSDRCFACHGPDAAVAQDAGGFRLDLFETATAPAASGATPIVPGDAAASELIRRLTSDNPRIVMPPPSAKLSVTDAEVDLLRRWIDAGGEYQGHWAYERPVKRPLPAIVNADWARNAVDYFVAARLEAEGLSPSGEADRATLIRRLSLDLTGLPPTPGQVDAFVNDASPGAYERVVDRLLASPHFGERLALVWLDAARYADTIGYQLDHVMNAWPYRDWVIAAFNDNMPYDRFVIEQLAGDLLPNATQDQRLATMFCRLHITNHEGGSIDEEFRVENVADRIETLATVFMAQTYTCARCHDHKYDPITQDDYFSLFTYFSSIDERGVYKNTPDRAQAYAPRMDWLPPGAERAVAEAERALAEAGAAREAQMPAVAAAQAAWGAALRARYGVAWARADLVDARSSHGGTVIERQDDGSVLLTGEAPAQEDLTLTLHTEATGLRLIRLDALTDPAMKGRAGRAENSNAVVSAVRVVAVSKADPTQTQAVGLRWAWASKTQQTNNFDVTHVLADATPGWAAGTDRDKDPRTLLLVTDEPFGFEGGSELRITVEHRSPHRQHTLGRVRVGFASASPGVVDAFPVVASDWYLVGPFAHDSFDKAYDTAYGPEQTVERIDIHRPAFHGKTWTHQPALRDGVQHALRGQFTTRYFGRMLYTPTPRRVVLKLGRDDAARVYLNGREVFSSPVQKVYDPQRDEVALDLEPGGNLLVVKWVNDNGISSFFADLDPGADAPLPLGPLALIDPALRTGHAERSLTTQWRDRRSPVFARYAEAERALSAARSAAVPVPVMIERDTPRQEFVLDRGLYSAPIKDRPAHRRPPNFMALPLPEGAPNNRLGFAQWLTRPDHPLTARVHVNRLWQMLFGTGIVKTAEDFGSQADWPSHPGLLDYLAVQFVESGWDQKALIKQVVMSATYRQKAVTQSESIEVDPDNRLLSYFPRRRLPAEMIRDQALFVSGLFNDTVGGPSVKPYQPPGLWRELALRSHSTTAFFRRDEGDALYRRSMYTFWKRKSPPPQMSTFDAPTREACVVRRDLTNTPLQALVLWNDEQFLEAARGLAQRTLAERAGDDERLSLMFQRCTGRPADARALGVLRQTLAHFRARYARSPADARALLQQGESPLPEVHDPVELAAWMMVGNTILSLDETIVRD